MSRKEFLIPLGPEGVVRVPESCLDTSVFLSRRVDLAFCLSRLAVCRLVFLSLFSSLEVPFVSPVFRSLVLPPSRLPFES